MIRIEVFDPPATYINDVFLPGMQFLAASPNPSNKEFKRHSYWKRIHAPIYDLYGGICCYCASWTPKPKESNILDVTSIDHFIPKSVNPSLAYDWRNFRLCRSRLNINKGNSLNIMDPIAIRNGWFILDFSSFLILPDPTLALYLKKRINDSITILGLNGNDYLEQRLDVILNYSINVISFEELQEKYPFIGIEMIRQDFDLNYKELISSL
jgi:hypothetical protein